MVNPKVTIGMPAYNRSHVLKDTIDQVLNQTYTDFELIIYNDGSKDDTSNIIRSYCDKRIVFIDNNINIGPPHPLNEIIKWAKGKYIIILHDHDFFNTKLLELSVEALDMYPTAGFVLQGCAWIDEDGKSNYQPQLLNLPIYNNGVLNGVEMISGGSFSSKFHACYMIRREIFEKVGYYYDSDFGINADVDLTLRLLKVSDFVYLNKVLFIFRTREATGHFLNNKEYQVVSWNYQIHCKNINLYFDGNVLELNKLLFNARRKFCKYIWIFALRASKNYNDALFIQGMKLIIAEDIYVSRRNLATILVKFILLRKVLMFSLKSLKNITKWAVNF